MIVLQKKKKNFYSEQENHKVESCCGSKFMNSPQHRIHNLKQKE